jgi:tRNA1(Val) A37 N6-methylase TrmN6
MQSKVANMTTPTIKRPFMTALKNDADAKKKLAEGNRVSVYTIERWLRNQNQLLTTAGNLTIIKKHFGLSQRTEILDDSVGV